jgi:hypothetical protein
MIDKDIKEIRNIINDAIEKQTEKLLQRMQTFENEVKQEIKDFKKSLTFLSEKYDELFDKVNIMDGDHKTLGIKYKELKDENSKLKKTINAIKGKQTFLDNQNKIKNVEIVGIPSTPNENLKEIAKKISNKLMIQEEDLNIEEINRNFSKKPEGGNIIMKLKTKNSRDKWINAFKKMKPKITTKDINENYKFNKVYINEHVSGETKNLLRETKTIKDSLKVKFIWLNEGKVFVREKEGTKAILVNNIEDIIKQRNCN